MRTAGRRERAGQRAGDSREGQGQGTEGEDRAEGRGGQAREGEGSGLVPPHAGLLAHGHLLRLLLQLLLKLPEHPKYIKQLIIQRIYANYAHVCLILTTCVYNIKPDNKLQGTP